MKEEIRKELNELESSLLDEKFKEEFKIPEGYFVKMQDEVIQKYRQKGLKKTKIVGLRRYFYAVAAVIVILIGVLFVMDQPLSNNQTFEQLDSEAIYAYLDENLEDISLQMLLAETPIDAPFNTDDAEIEVLEDYLEENLDDLSIEELEKLL